MRISDWSSDVCSSDLLDAAGDEDVTDTGLDAADGGVDRRHRRPAEAVDGWPDTACGRPASSAALRALLKPCPRVCITPPQITDRKSDGCGKRVSVCVDRGGRRLIQKKQPEKRT